MTEAIPRWLLEKYFGGDPRMLRAMEDHSQSTVDTVAATQALKDATVIVLSANGDFTNERVLVLGDGIEADIDDSTITLRTRDVARTENFTVTLLPTDNSIFNLPPSGTLLGTNNGAALPDFANDADAATGGVELWGLYWNGTAVVQRRA